MTIIRYDRIDMDTGLLIESVNYEPPFKDRVYVRAVYANFTRAPL